MSQQYVVIASLRGRLRNNARFLVSIVLFCCSGVGELLAKLLRIDLAIKISNRNWKKKNFPLNFTQKLMTLKNIPNNNWQFMGGYWKAKQTKPEHDFQR